MSSPATSAPAPTTPRPSRSAVAPTGAASAAAARPLPGAPAGRYGARAAGGRGRASTSARAADGPLPAEPASDRSPDPGALGKNTDSSSNEPDSNAGLSARAAGYEIRAALRVWAKNRPAKCGRTRVAGAVTLGVRTYVGDDGTVTRSAHWSGVMRCGLVWACPVCALAIRAERTADVEHVAEWWCGQGGALFMLTLTVRHGWTDDPRETRKGLTRAWARLASGRPWREWCARLGLGGWVRVIETTHGRNGWHPHLHILMGGRSGLSAADVAAIGGELAERWAAAVAAELGEGCRPDLAHGCDFRPAPGATKYLAKIALELTAAATKRGRKGDNRTPWQIAADFAAYGDCDDLDLWRRYAAAMRGARFMEWSRNGLDWRTASGLGKEKTDEEAVDGDGDVVPLLDVRGDDWDARGELWRWQLEVEAAIARGDVAAVARLIPGAQWRDPGPEAGL